MAIGTKDLGVQATAGSKRQKVHTLAIKHKPLFLKENVDIPKWNPREVVQHQDEYVVLFRPEELYGGVDIYTEFVTKNYIPADPDRKLYKWIYNPHYETEYQLSEPHPANGQRFYYVNIDELVNVTELHTDKPARAEIVVEEPIKQEPVKEEPKIEVVEKKEVEVKTEELSFEPDLADSDLPISAMTIRDQMAIQEWIPCSKKKWINQIITKHPRK